MDKEQMPEACGSEPKLPYVKPRLYKHGAISGLTQAYLQGPPPGQGPPAGGGPPAGTKYIGSNDLSRSAQGT